MKDERAEKGLLIETCTADGCSNKGKLGSTKYCHKHWWRLKNWGALERTLQCCMCGKSFHLQRKAADPDYCPQCRLIHNNAMRYGISGKRWMQIAESQNWSCSICLSHFDNNNLVTDHDHATGQVRGLLCNQCNLLLGLAKENPINLVSAVVYLERHAQTTTTYGQAQ